MYGLPNNDDWMMHTYRIARRELRRQRRLRWLRRAGEAALFLSIVLAVGVVW